MVTDTGVVFFEGNVAAYRTPRRIFLCSESFEAFLSWRRDRSC